MKASYKTLKITALVSALLIMIVFELFYFFPNLFYFQLIPTIVQPEQVIFCEKKECQLNNMPYQNSQLPVAERVADLMARMTLAEKIGQMALVEKNIIKDFDDIARYGLGALLSGSGSKPASNSPQGWQEMINNYQAYSQKTRLSIPLFYGADASHGNSNIMGVTVFPHFIGLGASRNTKLVKEVARATAEETLGTGINWVFSPNLDISSDIRWGRTYETFGSDSQLASVLGQAYVEGLQAVEKDNISLAASAKHYIANGATVWGSSSNKNFFIDQGNAIISEEDLRKTELAPFRSAIGAGVKSIMVGLNKYQGEKVVFNKYLISDVLKEELNFKGFVFSDWYGVFENENNKYQALVKAINAGIDMIMLPYDYKFFSASLSKAVARGDISEARINDAVRRILTVKFELGLFDQDIVSVGDFTSIRSDTHLGLARQAVRESLVLLKNDRALPLAKNPSKILVAGSAANNLGRQLGAWTVEWQGIDGNWVPGTTILKGIENAVSPNTKIEYDLNGNFTKSAELADFGIAVVGEAPYAEGWGDKLNPSLTAEDIRAINNLKKVSKKVIVVIVSGRPLDIKAYINDWDGVVAAWLPGSEGQGVADVLFGDYKFKGVLPLKWDLK